MLYPQGATTTRVLNAIVFFFNKGGVFGMSSSETILTKNNSFGRGCICEEPLARCFEYHQVCLFFKLLVSL